MGKKETVSELGVCLSRHHQILTASFPKCFPLGHVVELKHNCFYSRLPKQLKAMVAYLKASTNEKTYSNYLQAVWEAEKKKTLEPSCSQTAASASKPKVTNFFPLWKLKGGQPAVTPSAWVAHLEEVSANKEEGIESTDSDGIKGKTMEFIVNLARAVNDAQQEEKHCYHCSSPDHFIRDCLLVAASRTDSRVQGYDEDQIALVIPDLFNFMAQVPMILGTPIKGCIMNAIREREIGTLATPWVNYEVAYLLAV